MAGPSGSTPILHLPFPVEGDTVDVPRDVQALATALDGIVTSVPIGALLMWPTVNPPAGFLICNGTTVPAAGYPALEAVLGSAGGNITLPNFVGRLPLGPGAIPGATAPQPVAAALKDARGSGSVKLAALESGVAAHNHSINGGRTVPAIGAWALVNATYGSGGNNNDIPMRQTFGAGFSQPSNVDNSAAVPAANSHENMPPYYCVNFIIRAL